MKTQISEKNSLTSSFRFSHRPHGLSSRISLSSSESSPLSLGDLCSDSLLLDRLPGMAENLWLFQTTFAFCFFLFYLFCVVSSVVSLLVDFNQSMADQNAHSFDRTILIIHYVPHLVVD